jgi:hypothetical protein
MRFTGDKHIDSGDRWSKKQIKEVIDPRNEQGIVLSADTYKVVDLAENYLWGLDVDLHTKRLTVDPLT